MRIYLMRHANAVEPGEWHGSDLDRPLSSLGLARLAGTVQHLHRLKMSANVLLTSPFQRARQTAQLLAEHLHFLQTVECPELASGARLKAFTSLLERYATAESIWVVSHMPEIAMFAAHVAGVPALIEEGFRPAQILAAEEGRLLWNRHVEDWPAVSA